MFENAKSDSKIIAHLNLKEETDRSEAVESAHATEKKPLMQKQPSSAVVWSIVVGSAILVSVTFPLLYVGSQSYASAVNAFRNDSARSS
jgi:Mn2+/Fe2+ NRAMP family transporter